MYDLNKFWVAVAFSVVFFRCISLLCAFVSLSVLPSICWLYEHIDLYHKSEWMNKWMSVGSHLSCAHNSIYLFILKHGCCVCISGFQLPQLILANLSNYTENNDMHNDRIMSLYTRAIQNAHTNDAVHTFLSLVFRFFSCRLLFNATEYAVNIAQMSRQALKN